MTGESLRVAQEALGGLLEVTAAVMEGRNKNGFAAVRPPGHHAEHAKAMQPRHWRVQDQLDSAPIPLRKKLTHQDDKPSIW